MPEAQTISPATKAVSPKSATSKATVPQSLVSKIRTAFEGQNMNMLAMGEDPFAGVVKKWIPTGLMPLDLILGGGFPTSRLVEIYGPEASFKTGTTLMGLDNCILMGGLSILNDAEQALDRRKVRQSDHPNFLYLDENILENFYAKAEVMLKTIGENPDVLSMYVWDSLPTTMPSAVFTEGFGAAAYGAGAKMHSEKLPVILKPLRNASCCMVIVNQVRDNMDAGIYDDPYTTPGGWAPKFLASIRIQVSPGGKLFWSNDKVGDPAGFYVSAYTRKNKLVAPMRKIRIPVTFDLGGDPAICLLDYLADNKVAKGPGGHWSIEGLDLGGTFYYRKFREVYRDNIDKIVDWFCQKFELKYSPEARDAVIQSAKAIYGRL